MFFAIAIIHMNKEDSNNTENLSRIEFDAHLMIIATWPGNHGDDIDLYVRDPRGEVVFFKQKNNSIMHLDRDDLGSYGDFHEAGDTGLISNRETVTIRSKFPGEFVVNLHAYSKAPDVPTPISVRIYQISNNEILLDKLILLDFAGEEKTACRFTVSDNGTISNVNELPMRIAAEQSWY
jgi:hypothetical protein